MNKKLTLLPLIFGLVFLGTIAFAQQMAQSASPMMWLGCSSKPVD